jgi:hypothetical protein
VSDSDNPNNTLRLRSLFKEAGLKSTRANGGRRLTMFRGRTRDWTFWAHIYNGWLHLSTYVCELPTAATLRADLFDAAMTANQKMSLSKFVKTDALNLEVEYRDEHVDGTVLNNLLGLEVSNLEEHYPRLFRIVTGDAVLESLEGMPVLEDSRR